MLQITLKMYCLIIVDSFSYQYIFSNKVISIKMRIGTFEIQTLFPTFSIMDSCVKF